MWTAGCCVHSNGVVLGAFALIGNNDQNTSVIQMSQVAVRVCPFVSRKPQVFF